MNGVVVSYKIPILVTRVRFLVHAFFTNISEFFGGISGHEPCFCGMPSIDASCISLHVANSLSHVIDSHMCCQCFQLGCLATLCNFATEGLRMLDSVCLGTPAEPNACRISVRSKLYVRMG